RSALPFLLVIGLALAYASLANINFLIPRLEKAATEQLSRKVSIDGPVRLGWSVQGPGLSFGAIAVDNLPGGTTPYIARLGRASALIPWADLIEGTLAPKTINADEGLVRLERREDGLVNAVGLPGPEESALLAPLTLRIKSVDIALVDYTLPLETHIPLSDVRLALTEDFVRFESRLSPHDRQTAEPAPTLTVNIVSQPTAQTPAADVQLRLADGARELTGRGTLRDAGSGGRRLALALDGSLPPFLDETLNGEPVAGGLTLDADALELDDIVIGTEDKRLAIAGRVAFETPTRLGLSIDATKPNLARLDGVWRPLLEAIDGPDEARAFAFLKTVDGRVRLTLNEATYGDLSLGTVSIPISSDQTRTRVAPYSIRGPLGEIGGTLTFNHGDTTGAALTIEGRRVDASRLLALSGRPPIHDGPVAIAAKLSGQGATLQAAWNTVNGPIRIAAPLSADDPSLAAALEAIVNDQDGEAAVSLPAGGKGCLLLALDAENGIATVRRLTLDATAYRLVGSGRVNLRTGEVATFFNHRKGNRAPFGLAGPLSAMKPIDTALFGPETLSVSSQPDEAFKADATSLRDFLTFYPGSIGDISGCTKALTVK
ncbi:MAG: hypothetical protein AAGH45_11440, partial [Pseudomonadota bacterium]